MLHKSKTSVIGFGVFRDAETKEIVGEFTNKINFENMSVALANALSNKTAGFAHELVLGNGGTTIDNLGLINYLPTNVDSQSATLYNETYTKVVDDSSPLNTDPTRNKIEVFHETGKYHSDIVFTATLDYGEPTGQLAFDNATNSSSDSQFVFDELGVRTYGGQLLSHAIFHPMQKSLNRALEVIYTIRISVS